MLIVYVRERLAKYFPKYKRHYRRFILKPRLDINIVVSW